MAATQYLVDSNILLRWVKPDHSDYPLVVSAIEAIVRRGDALCYTSQNVGEFWNTCTRPVDRNGEKRTSVQGSLKESSDYCPTVWRCMKSGGD